MQVQNRLKRCNWGNLCGFRPWGLVLATILLLGLSVPYTIVAQDSVEGEIAAQRKKAEELLDTASAQLDRQQYQACQKTLDRCDAYRDKITSSQEKRFNKYSQEAQAGSTAQTNADAAIRVGAQHLSSDRLGSAQEQFQIAYKLKKYLPAPQRKKIEDQLKVIKAKQKMQKKDIVTLFKKSKSDYKAGRLAEAEKGFTKVRQSGIKLGFFDTGDFTNTAGYLKKIAGKREKQTEAERKRQQELIKIQEEAEKQKQKEESIPTVVEPTPAKVNKKEFITLFKESKSHYKAGRLDEAKEGFTKIQQGGVKLGFLDTGDLTSSSGYLKKIANERAKQAEAERERQQEILRKQQAEAERERQQEILRKQKEQAEKTEIKQEPKVVEPTSKKVTPDDELTQIAAPTPSVTTPTKQAPKEKVAPAPTAVEKKKKFDPLGFLKKKKKPDKSPATINLINQKMALADQAWTRGNYAQAKQLFMQVLALDPEYPPAQRGLSAAEYNLAHPKAAPRKTESTILDRLIGKEERQKQFIEASFTEARKKVYQLMGQKLYDDARAQVTSVLAKIEGHKQLLGPASYQKMRSDARGWLDLIEKNQREYEKQDLLNKQREAQEKQITIQRRIEADRIKKIEELYNRALTYKAERDYVQAIATLNNLLELDPKNERAQIILESLDALQLILRQAKARSKIEIERQKNLTDLDESSVPFRDKINYPGQDEKFEEEIDWLSLTERRKQTLAGITPIDQAVHDKLSDTKVTLDYQEVEFSQVLADLQNNEKLNLNPLWGSLETTAGINQDDTITLQLNQVPLEKALDSILEYVSSGKYAKAAYTIDMGVITIAAEDDLPERFYVEDYYVADLVGQQAGGMGGMGMMGGMGGMGMMGGMGGMGMMGGMGRGMMGGMGGMGRGMMGGRGGYGGRSGSYGGRSSGRGGRYGGYGSSGYGSNQGRYEGNNSSSDLSLTMYGGYGGSRGGYGGSRGGYGGSRGGRSGMMGGMGRGMMGGGMGRGMMGGMGGMMGGMGGMGGMMGGMGMGMGMGGGYRVYELIYLLQQAVGIDQWEGYDELEQAQGTIDVYGSNVLIVKQTWKNHRVISQLLARLRKTLGEQVALEIRLLEINSNFLEDIGLDIDFFLNLGNAGFDDSGEFDVTSGRKILIPRANPGPWNRTTPMPIIQNSYNLTTPATTSIPGSLGGGINQAFLLSGSFLDNVQVDFLMRATQAHQRSRFLDAPHVTVFNGESASVTFDVEQPYVSELTAVVDNRIGLFEPTIDTANTGVNFYITPTISADKRYVILNVFFTLENVLRFETFTFNVGGDVTTTETTDGNGDETDDGDGLIISGGSASTGTLQQPVTENNSIMTRVMVPDGGTLMLGGRKRSTEVEKEVGVPALSKLPLINRLFTNRSIVSDSSVLLILVKPKIILPKEEEELRFGSFETDAATEPIQ